MAIITGTLSVEENGVIKNYHFVAAPDNTAPVAVDDVATTPEDTWVSSTLNLQDNDLDVDGDALSIDPVSVGTFTTTAGGSITVNADGSYTYTPPVDFVGDDTFDYTVTDGSLTDVGTLIITVTAVPTEPVTLDPAFDEELQAVDPNLSLVAEKITDGSYGLDEYSINDLTIVGGSEEACAAGASYFLREMQGYRWHAPMNPDGVDHFSKRPSSIVRGLTLAKRQDIILSSDYGLQFGFPTNGGPTSPINSSGNELYQKWVRWRTLNHIGENKYPVGHAQQHVKNENQQFFIDNPDLLMPGVNRFDLYNLSPERMDVLTEICAAWILSGKLNGRHNKDFDPPDGNPHDAETEWAFIHAVGDKVRAGTGPIGQYPAFEGVPDARLGALAYFQHAEPVSFPITPDYASVATVYGNTSLTVDQLVEGWGQLTDELLMYIYLGLPDWYKNVPGRAWTLKTNYFQDNLPKWQNWGITRNTYEASANWLWDAIHINQIISFNKNGDASFQNALDEVMADVYDDDPAVRDLMEIIHDPVKRDDIFALSAMFECQPRMQEGWYKEFWRQVLYLAYEVNNLPLNQDITAPDYDPANDPWPQKFSDMCAHAWHLDRDNVYHSWGFISTVGKWAQGQGAYYPYPDLDFARKYKWPEIYGDTYPDFMVSTYPSTQAEFDAAKAVLDIEAYREHAALLDDEDLVLVENMPLDHPTFWAMSGDDVAATEWHTRSGIYQIMKFYKTEPDASFTISDVDNGYPIWATEKYNSVTASIDGPAGFVYDLPLPGRTTDRGKVIEWTGGYMFPSLHPYANIDNNKKCFFLYVPSFADMDVLGSTQPSSTLTLMQLPTPTQQYIKGPLASYPVPQGQVRMSNGTRGYVEVRNINKYASPLPSVALMPRALAEMDGLI